METTHNPLNSPLSLQPAYHLRPNRYWMNDPNGPIYWKGAYRMFFQHNPIAALWGNIHWAYASSPDMVHWTLGTPVLQPGPELYDREGVFSGSAIEFQEKLFIYYTGNSPQTQCLALGEEGSGETGPQRSAIAKENAKNELRLRKYVLNPVIKKAPLGMDGKDFRDPFVWQDGNVLRMIVGSGNKGSGLVLQYHSLNGMDWEYRGIYFEQKLPASVPAFECPLFFTLEGKSYLILSPYDTPYWILGKDRGDYFQAYSSGALDASSMWYAPNTFLAEDGRRIMIGWLKEERPDSYLLKEAWAGCLSLPREVYTTPEGSLACRPVRELEGLRKNTVDLPSTKLEQNNSFPIAQNFSQGELELCLERSQDAVLELCLFCSPKGQSILTLTGKELLLDPEHSSPHDDIRPTKKSLSLSKTESPIKLRIFVDRSTIEIFLNDGSCMSSRVYPDLSEQAAVSLTLKKGTVVLLKGAVHEMDGSIMA